MKRIESEEKLIDFSMSLKCGSGEHAIQVRSRLHVQTRIYSTLWENDRVQLDCNRHAPQMTCIGCL